MADVPNKMKSTTIAFVTAREFPCFDWFLESLERRVAENKAVKWSALKVIVIDHHRRIRGQVVTTPAAGTIHCAPKPTVWSGPDKVTKEEWWSVSNARNTALCLCETEWIAFLDDRSVLQPGWFQPILDAQKGDYIVAGTYEKRHSMTAYGGHIQHSGIITGEDGRAKYQASEGLPNPCPSGGDWLFGCNFALPLEWALEVNGVCETCDGNGGEDSIFGTILANSGKHIRFDNRMKIVEDRTPGKCGPVMIKEDWGVSPMDKSHWILKRLSKRKSALHKFDIRAVREQARKGFGFPKPWGPEVDEFTGIPLGDLLPKSSLKPEQFYKPTESALRELQS